LPQNANILQIEPSIKLKYIEEKKIGFKEKILCHKTWYGNIKFRMNLNMKTLNFLINYRLSNVLNIKNIEYFIHINILLTRIGMLKKWFPNPRGKRCFEYHMAMLETSTKIDDSHSIFKTKKL
jgi:hypothetical protein